MTPPRQNVAVLMAWRAGGCEHRQAAFDHVTARYEQAGWPVTVCDDDGDPFSWGVSNNTGAAGADADIYVIADADIIVGLDLLADAVDNAHADPGVVIGFETYRYLTPTGTDQVLAGDVEVWDAAYKFDLPGSVGPVLAVSAATFDTIGGFDPRFRGWGYEDIAFEVAGATLCAPTRHVTGTAYHLWHPTDRNRPRVNAELAARYLAARTDPFEMRALIDETRCVTPS